MSQSLFQQITTDENFHAAWEKVRSNLGAPGIDRVSVEEFEKNVHENLALLRQLLLDGTYEHLPYLTFTHKKDSGKPRTLRIPSVRDRIVQQAILMVLQPIFEKMFLNCSYAYRPGKSSQKAIERVERNLKRGRVWIVDADIKNFFDEVERQLLMKFVAETLTEKAVLKLIEQAIYALENPDNKGIAQGMVLAPLLSNIYLHRMDDKMMRAEWNYIRYSDNLLVLCKLEEEAKTAYARAEECLRELKLAFNPEKTSIGHLRDGFSFLGFYFDETGKRPDAPAVQRLHQRIGAVLQKATDYSEVRLKEKLESIVRGWLNYFKLPEKDKKKLLQELEQKTGEQGGSMPQTILKAALEYQLGDHHRARNTLKTSTIVESQDVEMNYQWAMLCDILGLNSEALDSYLAAFRINSEHPDVACQIGLHYLKTQQSEQAIRYLQKAVQVNPNSAVAHFALGTALQQISLHGAARKAFQRAAQLDNRMKKMVQTAMPQKKQKEKSPPLNYSEEDLSYFLRLFLGREGVFARQWLSNEGKIGYMPVHQPLNKEDVKNHIHGKQTLGIYLMRSDNTVSQLVIDIDMTRQVRADIANTARDIEAWKRIIRTDAENICQVFRDLKIESYLEDSGYKGMHVWVFFSRPILARDVLLFAKKVLTQVEAPPAGLHREVFPKEARVAPKALGSMIKLPLGIHKLTNRRCLFLDRQGEPFTDQFAVLRNVQSVSENQFMKALDHLKSQATQVVPKKEDLDLTPIDKIMSGCNVIRYLKEKAEKEKWLNHTERLTLLAVFGHFGKAGGYAIHEIMGHTTNYNYRITQKWLGRVRNYPISCPKIREWHSHITPVLGCPCDFPNVKNSYPSPVLHADPQFIVRVKAQKKKKAAPGNENKSSPQPLADSAKIPGAKTVSASGIPDKPIEAAKKSEQPVVNINEIFRNYLDAKRQQREINHQLKRMEQQLHQLCEQNNTDQLETEIGVLKRIKVGTEYRWVVEI